MNARLFINSNNFVNTGIVIISDKETTSTKRIGDVEVIYHNDEIIGYNLFNFTTESNLVGYCKMNEALLALINAKLSASELETLTYDFTPKFLVGFVSEMEAHPDSDHLNVCQVDVAGKTLQIVCGASNVAQGQRVVVATDGAIMPTGQVIRNGKLRKVLSEGMLCSEYELGLISEKKKGILVLDENFEIGAEFQVGGN